MIRDPLTGERTLLGRTRAARPDEYRDGPSAACPFCPGNESQTPPEIARYGDERAWRVRAFANKYPAIAPPEGMHEVIVDAPDHAAEITADGMRMWRERYLAARAAFPDAVPVLFKNRGAHAGATIRHPHAQLIALRDEPVRFAAMRARGAAHRARTGRCSWCDEATRARATGLAVRESADAIAYVREHARFGWALTIVPFECTASLANADPATWSAAGSLLGEAVRALLAQLGDEAPFNVLVPSDALAAAGEFHWHLELVPRLATFAGFELASGMYIRSAAPQESAERWRRMFTLPHGSI